MMFNKWKRIGVVLLCELFLILLYEGSNVQAKELTTLPKGEILIMYSEGASEEDLENVISIVETLTYQSFQVTYAPASKCLGELDNYSFILCYKIERFPNGLIEELKKREEEGNSILNRRKDIKNSTGEKDIRILFVGNEFLRSYLKITGRENAYIDSVSKVGKAQYFFNDQVQQEALVREGDFLFLLGELDYESGTIEVDGTEGYFCASIGSIYHIPVSDLKENLVKAAFTKEVAQWKWPYNGEPHTYAQYMVINEVYPFQDSDKLLQVINYMVAKEVPFIISVMPIYNNGNYPTMQHFCEVLRYAQANGGTIILHSPINQMPNFNVDLVKDYLTTAVSIYKEQGVYPMAIQVPRNWMLNSDTIEIMSHFRTVLVAEEEDALVEADEDVYTNLIYKDGHQWIAPSILLDANGVSYLKTNSVAVYFDLTDNINTIENKVKACIASDIPLKSLWDIEHSFWTEEDVMTYSNHIIFINGKRVENNFVATDYEEDFQYKRNMLQRYSKDLSQINKKLMIVVVAISLIFIWFILTARHRNRKTFFVKNSEGKEDKKKK